MSIDSVEKLANESDSELERVLHTAASPVDAATLLARLLWAFDARRRSRETLALRESARELGRL